MQQRQLLTLGCDEGKYRVYCRVPSKENGQLMLKRLKLSDGLKEGSFKGNILGEDCKVHDFLLIGWS